MPNASIQVPEANFLLPETNLRLPGANLRPPEAETDAERGALLALALCEGIGAVSFHRLLEAFGSPEAVFAAPEWELKEAYPRIGAGALIALRRGPDLRLVEQQESECRLHGVRLVTFRSPDYPDPLRELPQPPPILYMKGRWQPSDRRALAVVGTRRPSPYGEKSARAFGLRLAEAGWTVVSGLARGVDTLAHEAALRGGSRTLAVLGSGLDRLYPRENHDLARRIAGNGCLISEYPMGMEPLPENFPRRNRLISALSYGTLVVEAGNDSGALITAEYALEQGREVFAVPGAIMAAGTRGTHGLIKQGAHLVDNVQDILDVLQGVAQARPRRRLEESDDAMSGGPADAKPTCPVPTRPDPASMDQASIDPASMDAANVDVAPQAQGHAAPERPPASRPARAAIRASRPTAELKASQRLILDLLGGEALSLETLAERMRALPGRSMLPTHRLLAEILQLEVLGLLRRLPGALFRAP